MRRCGFCGRSIVNFRAQARFCSDHCRTYARRRRLRGSIPARMLDARRWMRYSRSKVPLTVTGTAASSTDQRTWATYAEAKASTAGVGLGFALGDGIGCVDLDHVLEDGRPTAAAAALLEQYRGHYIEVSPSRTGLHIWGLAPEGPGRRGTEHGVSVERYSVGRYITVTGEVYQAGELLPLR